MTILKGLGWVVGGVLVVLGVARILFPVATIPGADTLAATVDSETRAGGVLLIAFGGAYIWAVRRSPIPSGVLRCLALIMALPVVSRVISMVVVGIPHPLFVVFTVVEFAAAALTYWYSTMRASG